MFPHSTVFALVLVAVVIGVLSQGAFNFGNLFNFIQPLAEKTVDAAIEQRVHVPSADLPSVAQAAAQYLASDNPTLPAASVQQVVSLLDDPTYGPAIASALDKALIDYTLHRAVTAAIQAVPPTALVA